MIFPIDKYRAIFQKERTMGVNKRINTALHISKTLIGFSQADRAAIRSLITNQAEARRLETKYKEHQASIENPLALMKLHHEGDTPFTIESKFMVIDKSTGRQFFVYFDGSAVVLDGKRIVLSVFNKVSYRWFRIPKLTNDDLSDL